MVKMSFSIVWFIHHHPIIFAFDFNSYFQVKKLLIEILQHKNLSNFYQLKLYKVINSYTQNKKQKSIKKRKLKKYVYTKKTNLYTQIKKKLILILVYEYTQKHKNTKHETLYNITLLLLSQNQLIKHLK